MVTIITPNAQSIADVGTLLSDGHIVAIPTETVYGLGADSTNDTAVAKIFEAKGRPQFNPLIAHVNSIDMAEHYADLSTQAKTVAQNFWPGPLTLILPLKPNSGISKLVTAGLETIGMRMPKHKTAQDIITSLNKPIAAPSANTSGQLSPTTPEHVIQSLGANLEYIVTGGKCDIGLESTILDMTGEKPCLLRAGAITREDIETLIGEIDDATTATENETPKSPGQMLKHYAPRTPLRLNAIDLNEGEALLGFGSMKFMGIKGGGKIQDLPRGHVLNLSEAGDLIEAASNLFSMLHKLDQSGAKKIAVMNIPDTGIGRAINDRLQRAVN